MTHKSKGKAAGRARRRSRIRKHISGTPERPRLSVFRSARHIYAQVIDDITGHTLAAASTVGKAGATLVGKKVERATAIGQQIAAACRAKDIAAVVFDRNGNQYHGRVKAIAEAARAGGLQF